MVVVVAVLVMTVLAAVLAFVAAGYIGKVVVEGCYEA
jgi:hypothetical protein